MSKLKVQLNRLKEFVSSLRVLVSRYMGFNEEELQGWSIEDMLGELENINVYQNPWEIVTESGTDALGDFTISDTISDNPNAISIAFGYYRLKEYEFEYVNLPIPYVPQAVMIGTTPADFIDCCALDMSNTESVHSVMGSMYRWQQHKGLNSYGTHCETFPSHYIKRLLLPRRFQMYTCTLCRADTLTGGLYLPADGSCSSNWIWSDSNTVEIPVKCPEGSILRYYLNKIGLSADDMVAIFNNLDAPYSYWSNAYITLGTTNLAKLTEAQMDIARQKGWDLQ